MSWRCSPRGPRCRPSRRAGAAAAPRSSRPLVATLIAIWRAFAYLPWDRGHQMYPARVVFGLHAAPRTGSRPRRRLTRAALPRPAARGSVLLRADRRAPVAVIDRRDALPRWRARSRCTRSRARWCRMAAAACARPSSCRGARDAGRCQRRVPVGGRATPRCRSGGGDGRGRPDGGTAPGVTKGALLDWRHWNPLAEGPQVNVDYMWNQTYAPLHWPKKRTTVLQVQARPDRHHRKAGLLDRLRRHPLGLLAGHAGQLPRHRRDRHPGRQGQPPRSFTPTARPTSPRSGSLWKRWPIFACSRPASRSATPSPHRSTPASPPTAA